MEIINEKFNEFASALQVYVDEITGIDINQSDILNNVRIQDTCDRIDQAKNILSNMERLRENTNVSFTEKTMEIKNHLSVVRENCRALERRLCGNSEEKEKEKEREKEHEHSPSAAEVEERLFRNTEPISPNSPSWADVVENADEEKKRVVVIPKMPKMPSPLANQAKSTPGILQIRPPQSRGPRLTMRQVVEGVSIASITIQVESDARKNLGYVCFCEKTQKYCFAMNGMVFAGAFANIQGYNSKPHKVLEFRHIDNDRYNKKQKVDPEKTGYYVPGQENRELTNRMIYCPAGERDACKNSYAYVIGSRDHLYNDLLHLSEVDYRYFRDIAMSFMLHMLVAQTEMIRRQTNKDSFDSNE